VVFRAKDGQISRPVHDLTPESVGTSHDLSSLYPIGCKAKINQLPETAATVVGLSSTDLQASGLSFRTSANYAKLSKRLGLVNGGDVKSLAARPRPGTGAMRADLFAACRTVLGELDNEIGGYPIVAWSPEGELRSVFHAGKGPIRPALIPVLVQDALTYSV
jgi:hypothetical protein